MSLSSCSVFISESELHKAFLLQGTKLKSFMSRILLLVLVFAFSLAKVRLFPQRNGFRFPTCPKLNPPIFFRYSSSADLLLLFSWVLLFKAVFTTSSVPLLLPIRPKLNPPRESRSVAVNCLLVVLKGSYVFMEFMSEAVITRIKWHESWKLTLFNWLKGVTYYVCQLNLECSIKEGNGNNSVPFHLCLHAYKILFFKNTIAPLNKVF